FWQIYFGRKQAIIDADQRRRELIQDKSDVRETGVADTDNTNTKEGQAGHAGHAAQGSVSESGNAGTAGDDDDDENFDWDE
nr:hypothetical protein [Shewanella ferrihydritica]